MGWLRDSLSRNLKKMDHRKLDKNQLNLRIPEMSTRLLQGIGKRVEMILKVMMLKMIVRIYLKLTSLNITIWNFNQENQHRIIPQNKLLRVIFLGWISFIHRNHSIYLDHFSQKAKNAKMWSQMGIFKKRLILFRTIAIRLQVEIRLSPNLKL